MRSIEWLCLILMGRANPAKAAFYMNGMAVKACLMMLKLTIPTHGAT